MQTKTRGWSRQEAGPETQGSKKQRTVPVGVRVSQLAHPGAAEHSGMFLEDASSLAPLVTMPCKSPVAQSSTPASTLSVHKRTLLGVTLFNLQIIIAHLEYSRKSTQQKDPFI